jgi:hypothetical protein
MPCIFSVLLDLDLRPNCHPIDTCRFSGIAEYPGRPANLSVRGYAAANSAARQPGVERSPQSSSLSPSGLNPPYQIGGHHSVELGLKLMFSTSPET